jgi:hypothetical protein
MLVGPEAFSLFFVDLFVLSNRVHLIDFPLSQGMMGSGWELCHLASSSRGGGGVVGSVILKLE